MGQEGQRQRVRSVLGEQPGQQRTTAETPMLAAVAAKAARARRSGGASSMTAAVAVPLNSPAAKPDSSRPAKSSGSPFSHRKQTALPAESASAASSTGRRPARSE